MEAEAPTGGQGGRGAHLVEGAGREGGGWVVGGGGGGMWRREGD